MTNSNETRPLLIGCGAGFSGDRWDAAGPVVDTLIARAAPAVLMFETLAERTLALAQLRRRADPQAGYEPSLENFVKPVLQRCVAHGIPIVGNFGAANPQGAARKLQQMALALGMPPLRIGIVAGDDLLATLDKTALAALLPPQAQGKQLVSANVYLGAQAIAQCLRDGAQVVVTGRVADPALALGPMLAHFGWAANAWDLLAAGTMAGHILECGAQVTGGYFADPGVKDVPDLANAGFPIVQMNADGSFVVGKADNTGGCVNARTVKEQLLYEIHDPAAYLTPDVVADIGAARVLEVAPDQVLVQGVRGHPRPATLKATVCFEGGWLAEGEISYAGPNALARAQLAAQVVRERVRRLDLPAGSLRFDFIGVASVFADDGGRWLATQALPPASDVRLRVAAATDDRACADYVTHEVLALYTCGPAGGGGVRSAVTPRLVSDSCFVPRELVHEHAVSGDSA